MTTLKELAEKIKINDINSSYIIPKKDIITKLGKKGKEISLVVYDTPLEIVDAGKFKKGDIPIKAYLPINDYYQGLLRYKGDFKFTLFHRSEVKPLFIPLDSSYLSLPGWVWGNSERYEFSDSLSLRNFHVKLPLKDYGITWGVLKISAP